MTASGAAALAAGLVFHGGAEEAVDTRLVAFAAGPEPVEDVGIEAHGDGFLDRAVELADKRARPVARFGDVGKIDLGVAQSGEGAASLRISARRAGGECWYWDMWRFCGM